MALPHGYSLAHSEFNAFHVYYIDEETPGPQLTVLSALAILGFEPWCEAARLAKKPPGKPRHGRWRKRLPGCRMRTWPKTQTRNPSLLAW